MTTQISVRLDEDLLNKIRKEAKLSSRSVNNMITRNLEEHYKVQELSEEQRNKFND